MHEELDVELFCARLWKRLVDTDGDGVVTLEELLKFIEEQDKDKSGILSRQGTSTTLLAIGMLLFLGGHIELLIYLFNWLGAHWPPRCQ